MAYRPSWFKAVCEYRWVNGAASEGNLASNAMRTS